MIWRDDGVTTSTAQVESVGAYTPVRTESDRGARHDVAASGTLRVRDLVLIYANGVRALDGVTVDLPPGRHTVLSGSSGSGKTSLLGCLSGRLTPTSGTVERRCGVAMIYQDLRLVPERTALANVLDGCLGRLPLGRDMLAPPRAERAAAEALLRDLGLAERARMPVRSLSGGERRRVAIARALMQQPAVLLADEPTCSLDPQNSDSVMRLLTLLSRERGVTLLTVLHDETLAERYADFRLHLRSGRLVEPPVSRIATVPGGDPACEAACPCTDAGPARTESSSFALPERSVWMRPAALLTIGVLGVAAYTWSAVSLGLHEAASDNAAAGAARFAAALLPGSWQEVASLPWPSMLAALVETVQMSLIGTAVGVCLAYPAAVLAARNIGPAWLRLPIRQLLNCARTVPSLIWGLFFIAAVGLGTPAGVLALSLYSAGYLGKFFYEAFENAPKGPQEALREIGASALTRFWRAVQPATRPAVLAAMLFMLEYNIRAASVLGIVGAGGIGYDIKFYLDIRNFTAALACLLLVFVVVVLLDGFSERLRRGLTPD